MVEYFDLAINIYLASYAIFATIIFWFTWRKRPDLVYWFISLIIFSFGHILLIFKHLENVHLLFTYLGNATQLFALLVVMVSTFMEYSNLVFKKSGNERELKREKIILIITITLTIVIGGITLLLLSIFGILDLFITIIILMIVLLMPTAIIVLRIYQKQKTITRLFMFVVFIVGAATALSTIVATFVYDWGTALNYAMNFIFMSFILTGAIAAPIEHRITSSEEKYRLLSEDLEVKVNERTKQLEVVNKELESFSYSVSHDLKTPLRGIASFSKILDTEYSENLNDEARDFLSRIIDNADRMNELINDLLTLSQISKYDFNPENVNLSKLVKDTFENLMILYPETKFELVIVDNLNCNCDPKLVRIIIENLLSNAMKFSYKVDNPIIKFGKTTKNGKEVYFVEDNGVGFDMNYYDKLFGLFQRLHTTEEYEGTGIGLITVKRIIDRHKGKIWAEGEVNKGASFYFTFKE